MNKNITCFVFLILILAIFSQSTIAKEQVNSSSNKKPSWLQIGGVDVNNANDKYVIHGITVKSVKICRPEKEHPYSRSPQKPPCCFRFENADPSFDTLWVQFIFSSGNIIYWKGKGRITNLETNETVSLPLLPPEDLRSDAERNSFFEDVYGNSATVLIRNEKEGPFQNFKSAGEWKEEVLLHDGSKIIVYRWQKREGDPSESKQSITFTLPGTKKIVSWKDRYIKEIGCSDVMLVALHFLNGIPYIITTPRSCLSYNKCGRPNPPYVIFKYDDKEFNVAKRWKRIDFVELPVEFKNINLVIDTLHNEKKLINNQGVTSAEMVKELNSSLTQKEYKTIVRTPLGGVGCPYIKVEEPTEQKGGVVYVYDALKDANKVKKPVAPN